MKPAAALTVAAAVAAAPAVYLVGLLAAAAAGSRRAPPSTSRGRLRPLVVVVPAHDEEFAIGATLASLAAAGADTTIVVADNCSDATADRAGAAGATVWERCDPQRPGKGRALAWAFERIQNEMPDAAAVAVVDADCTVSRNLLEAAGARLAAGARAVQASYMVANPHQSPAAAARYAGFVLINHVRPLGKSTLGLSSGLLGSGMAFDVALLRQHPWSAFDLTEDSEYHLRLVRAGVRVEFAPEARVVSVMPTSLEGADTQRERWESGGFDLALRAAGGLIADGLRMRDASRLNAGLELFVPPQSLLLMANITTCSAALAFRVRAARRAAAIGLLGQAAYVLGGLVLVRAPASAYRGLAMAPLLAARNAKLYVRLARGWRPRGWIRTRR